jgi:DDE superfamily endonuclease
MDGHISHTNIKFMEFCWKYKIIPIYLPPHLTHFLQPLDLVIFLMVKHLYSAKVDKYSARGVTGINRDYFLQILGEIKPQIYTPELIDSAFKAAGLLPFNPN